MDVNRNCSPHERSDMRELTRFEIPDIAEPVIGPRSARTRWLIRATALRDRAISRNDLKLIWPIQPNPKKYSAFFAAQISIMVCRSRPDEGRFAIVTNVGWDAVDAGGVVAHGSAGRVFGSRER